MKITAEVRHEIPYVGRPRPVPEDLKRGCSVVPGTNEQKTIPIPAADDITGRLGRCNPTTFVRIGRMLSPIAHLPSPPYKECRVASLGPDPRGKPRAVVMQRHIRAGLGSDGLRPCNVKWRKSQNPAGCGPSTLLETGYDMTTGAELDNGQ